MAGRIYVTGDCHGSFHKFSMKNFPEQRDLDKEDYVIICGDFGGIWAVGRESRHEQHWLDWLEAKSYTTLFVDGNHENFDRVVGYPQKEWHGGIVHEIRPSVLHLSRGQIFDICGMRVFAFGGASSHDISDGILDPEEEDFLSKKKRFDREYKQYRIRHLTWWDEEIASLEEMRVGKESLRRNDYAVDYIITHCGPTSILPNIAQIEDGEYLSDRQTDYLEYIRNYANYSKWYFGHYHIDSEISEKEVATYNKIVRLI